jgi:hypothetical protein
MRRVPLLITVTVLSVVMLGAVACEPLRNAPPGGGETVTTTFRLGPFTLGPGGEVMGSPRTGVPRPSGAFGLKSARFDIVDQNGAPVSVHDVHLHHIVLTTTARDDRLCPGRPERFVGSGMERTPVDLWGPYTYLVGASDQWGAIYHVMNETPAGTPAKTVYIQYTLGYEPGANATNSRPVTPLFQDVTGCGPSTYDIPGDGGPGSVHIARREWQSPRDGMAIFAGGHLHDGGIDIRLLDTTADVTLCKAVATYHEDPRHLASINPCVIHEKVVAGHTYRVAARYDNSMPYQDVMGIMLTYVWWGTQ